MRVFFAIVFALLSVIGPGAVARADVTGAIRVIDGDTFDVGAVRVHLFGIDAPESDQTCVTQQGANWDCGAWVTAEVATRFDGRIARCEVLDVDRYGRSVARCRVEGVDVARQLVREGLAFAYRRYSLDYDLDEKSAAVRDVGLHASRVQSPAQFRKARNAGGPQSTTDCAIKGNISSKGVRIYHVPGQRDYAQTRIAAEKGERWFCNEDEARAAGWRKARR